MLGSKPKSRQRRTISQPQAELEKMSIVGSSRPSQPGSRNGGAGSGHMSEGSLRSNASSSFRRLDEHQQPYASTSNGMSPVTAALQSCVKVFCTAVAPSYMLPWMRGEESHRVGSGFAAQLPSGERRLFTHAQVVENCTLVQVRRAVDAQKFVARVRCLPQTVCRRLSRECPRPYPPRRASPASQVVCVGFDVDIAVLHVDDPSFWEAIPALPLPTELPGIMTEVMAVGARAPQPRRACIARGWPVPSRGCGVRPTDDPPFPLLCGRLCDGRR